MIIRSEDLKNICQIILHALDSNDLSQITDTLEIRGQHQHITLCITNRESFVKVSLPIDEEVDFQASVSASLFLKLICQTTTDTISFEIKNNFLSISANGKYKLPLIYEGDKLLSIPQILLKNVVNKFSIESEILNSIYRNNTCEVKDGAINPIQKLYYLDEEGCITFTSGACVNKFSLPQHLKILLNRRIVKLFKLFHSGPVKFTLAQDPLEGTDLIQTKIKFEDDTVAITSIIATDNNLLNEFPAEAIRTRAFNIYPYSVTLNRELFLQALNRLSLFFSKNETLVTNYTFFTFKDDMVSIRDRSGDIVETLYYQNEVPSPFEYSLYLDLQDIKSILETCKGSFITVNFGNHEAVVLVNQDVYRVIPECVEIESLEA